MSIRTAATVSIGTTYTDRNEYLCRVDDKLTTRNEAGEVVNWEWLCSHELMGCRLSHRENTFTIQRNIWRNEEDQEKALKRMNRELKKARRFVKQEAGS